LVPPTAPTGLTATGGYSVVELDWDDSGSDVVGYKLYRSTSSGSSGSVLASNLTASAYSDSAVDNFTTYYYRVTAVGTNGLESSFSGQVSATPVQDPSGPPAAPTGLTADAGDALVSLDWDDNNDIDLSSYSVYRSTTSGSYLAGPLATNLLSSSYEDTNAVNGTTYYYVVTASDTNGLESAQSSEVSAAPVLDTPPAAPAGLTATAGNGSVSLDWNDNSEEDFDTYTVYRSTTSSNYTVALASNLASSAYTDSDVVNGSNYYYVVTATDTSGKESATSSEVSATPEALPLLTASFDFGTDPGKDSIEDAGLTTYIQDDTPGEMIISNIADGIVLHDALGGSSGREAMGFYRTFTGLGPNDTNDFVITTTFTTPIPNWNQPSIGIHLFGDVTSGSYWENGIYACVDKNENLEIWDDGVERGTIVGSGTISAEVVNGSATTIRVEGTYGTYGTDNLQLVLTVLQPGVAMNSITGTVDTTGFSISQTGFGVSSGTDDENKFIVDTLWVGPQSAAPSLPPAAPTGLSATPGNNSVSLNWNDNSEDNIAGYSVYRSTTSGSYSTTALAANLSSSSYVDNTAVNSNTYYYVVTATDTSGNESVQSDEVSATPDPGVPSLTGYEAWAAANSMGAATEDDDGDGLINLYEYGLGGDSGTEPTLPEFTKTETGFTYVYPELADPDSGITYTVQSNTNLLTDTWVDLAPSGTIPGDPLNTVAVNIDTAADGKFIRLKIEQ
jgi:fibronectin type 3 domain-containing protein